MLGLIVALSIFFVAIEYSTQDDTDKQTKTNLLKDLKIHDQEMMPAIDQQNLAKEKNMINHLWKICLILNEVIRHKRLHHTKLEIQLRTMKKTAAPKY